VEDFMIYINGRKPEIDAEIAPYLKKYPNKIRVLGDANNYGILRGMIALTNNATRPYFLFLERDFQLIEPDTCVYEQLTAGLKLIKEGTAHVVKYRHRRKAGRPNWAERMFRGHEDDALTGRQPNLFCNVVRVCGKRAGGGQQAALSGSARGRHPRQRGGLFVCLLVPAVLLDRAPRPALAGQVADLPAGAALLLLRLVLLQLD
jgi:hypothetical protein